ncbi:MAG: hypothetical protein GY765_16625, partial [bacterium]|nr:hypothetical protein [bacterium]
LIRELKGSFLLHDLKNYLVTCIYAVSSHDSNLRLFITPNMTRFHDFSVSKGKSPWRHSAVAKELGKEDVYHLEGGLSRMNITLAGAASEFLFRREIGYFPVQTAPIVYNNLDLFPKPNIGKAQEYTGLLVQLARHLMEKAPQSADVREFLKTEISGMTTGYFYHRMLLHLEGKTKDFRPPYSYLLRLGESLAACKRFMDDFPGKQRLEALRSPMEIKTLNRRMNRLGSIYYYTFGKLLPHRYRLFPLPLSNFFRSKRVGGEMINEMKVKAAYISYDQEMPSQFLGYFILSHLYNFSHQYSQAYNNDYERTHYLYGLYN